MTRSSLNDDHFRCYFYGFDVLRENKSVTFVTVENTRPQCKRRVPRNPCDLRYQCSELIFFKARRGFHFTRLNSKYQKDSDQQTSVLGHIYLVKWLTDRETHNWMKTSYFNWHTKKMIDILRSMKLCQNLYGQMTNQVKLLMTADTQLSYIVTPERATITRWCWLTAAYGTVVLSDVFKVFLDLV